MSSASWGVTHSGLHVPGHALPGPRPVAVDLFAGAGGFSVGFHQAGWRVAAAVEFDRAASLTYLCNLGSPETTIHCGPGLDKQGPFDGDGWTHHRASDAWPEAGSGWISHRGQRRFCLPDWGFQRGERTISGTYQACTTAST